MCRHEIKDVRELAVGTSFERVDGKEVLALLRDCSMRVWKTVCKIRDAEVLAHLYADLMEKKRDEEFIKRMEILLENELVRQQDLVRLFRCIREQKVEGDQRWDKLLVKIAAHPNLPSEIAYALRHKNGPFEGHSTWKNREGLTAALASNRATPREILRAIGVNRYEMGETNERAIINPNFPPEIIEEMIAAAEKDMREHEGIVEDDALLKKLLGGRLESPQRGLNPAMTVTQLRRMLNLADGAIRFIQEAERTGKRFYGDVPFERYEIWRAIQLHCAGHDHDALVMDVLEREKVFEVARLKAIQRKKLSPEMIRAALVHRGKFIHYDPYRKPFVGPGEPATAENYNAAALQIALETGDIPRDVLAILVRDASFYHLAITSVETGMNKVERLWRVLAGYPSSSNQLRAAIREKMIGHTVQRNSSDPGDQEWQIAQARRELM